LKIRQDFVTNSSCTSYIISLKDDFTLDNFLKAIAVDKNCVLIQLFIDMFNVINRKNRDINIYLECENSYTAIISEIEKYYRYGEKVRPIIKELMENKRKIYMGQFDDHESEMESYLCATSIIGHNKDIYFFSEDSF
jgi:hypothetical protein